MPKSSMATSMFSMSSVCMVRWVSSPSRSIALSVISSSRRCGDTRRDCKVRLTPSTKDGWPNQRAEMFTATRIGGTPARSQAWIWAQVACSTHSSMRRIRPRFSATGMNSPGSTSPRSGCCQRSSASTATMRPLPSSMLGWNTRRNSPRLSA